MKIKFLYWLPRILCILSILFISMFALDAFDGPGAWWRKIPAFLVHLTPSYILLLPLLIAWRWEKLGGIILILIGMIFSGGLALLNYHRTNSVLVALEIALVLGVPFIIYGLLFLWSHHLQKPREAL